MMFSSLFSIFIGSVTLLPFVNAAMEASQDAESAVVRLGGTTKRRLKIPMGDAITFVKSNGDGTVTVRLRQTVFGDRGTCGDGRSTSQAMVLFSVFTDPAENKPVCHVHRDVDACWEEKHVIQCDPNTNMATVDLYIRDELFSSAFHQVENPKVGNCLGTSYVIGKTIMWSAAFDCTHGGEGPGSICVNDSDCMEGLHCAPAAFYSDPPTCQPYAAIGEPCGGMMAPGMASVCDPAHAMCLNHFDCLGAFDFGGMCTPIGNACTSDSQCDASDYCDSVCKPRRSMGECCGSSAPCEAGMTCAQIDMFGFQASLCQ